MWDHSVALNLSQGEFLNTKALSWVDILQLTRTVNQKRNDRSPKAKSVHLESFRTLDFDGSGLCFHFGRWCYVCAVFYGTSIMKSVVLRSGRVAKVCGPVAINGF